MIIVCCLALLLPACKKYGNGYVEGTVYETGSNAVIPGVQMFYGKWKKRPISGDVDYELLGSTLTDNSGHYRFNFKKERGYRYSVYCKDSTHTWSLGAEEMDYKKSTHDFYLAPFAYLKIRIKKSSSADKYIDITLNTASVSRIRSRGPMDTLLPTVYRLSGNSNNFIYWYITEVPAPPAYEITGYFEERDVYAAKGDTLSRTFVID